MPRIMGLGRPPLIIRSAALVLASVVAVTAMTAVSGQPAAAKRRSHHGESQAAPKECIRFNARNGFYRNIWCSPAEQDRFDRWEAARLQRH